MSTTGMLLPPLTSGAGCSLCGCAGELGSGSPAREGTTVFSSSCAPSPQARGASTSVRLLASAQDDEVGACEAALWRLYSSSPRDVRTTAALSDVSN
mmetsp:Transcript_19876/g.48955  ORF Transcript_19876/g.48955 Transcript_19876/m.48955 type:complete len:97 (+) Transcript_19876:216-506(+)